MEVHRPLTWASSGFCRSLQYINPSGFKRVTIGSNPTQTLFTIKNVNVYSADFGQWFGITPDNSVIFTRDVSPQDI